MVEFEGNHFLTGADHLLFLLILLLPAPLRAIGARWNRLIDALFTRRRISQIGRITIAFIAGHSVALAATVLGRLKSTGRPVEAFSALGMLVGAIHAIRPLFPGREAVVVGVFGPGHGMAFSFVLAEMHLSTGRLVFGILGLNLGIEPLRLLLVCLVLPSLLGHARMRIQPVLRLSDPRPLRRTSLHRLNPGGDRQANHALCMIAVNRTAWEPRAQAYVPRRTTAGKTNTEIVRCLKRHIVREIYRLLVPRTAPQQASCQDLTIAA